MFIQLGNDDAERTTICATTLARRSGGVVERTVPLRRKIVLDAIRDELRTKNYIPMMFDFEPLPSQTLIQTVSTLAHMSRFIIADVTEPRSVPHELGTVVPSLPMVPLQPILLASETAWAMFPT